jgi:hypothetical protein
VKKPDQLYDRASSSGKTRSGRRKQPVQFRKFYYSVSPFFRLFVMPTTIQSLFETASVDFSALLRQFLDRCQTTDGAVATHVLPSSEGTSKSKAEEKGECPSFSCNSPIGSRFHFVVVQDFCAAVIAVPPFGARTRGEAGDSIGTRFSNFSTKNVRTYALPCAFSVFVRTMGTAPGPGGGKS